MASQCVSKAVQRGQCVLAPTVQLRGAARDVVRRTRSNAFDLSGNRSHFERCGRPDSPGDGGQVRSASLLVPERVSKLCGI